MKTKEVLPGSPRSCQEQHRGRRGAVSPECEASLPPLSPAAPLFHQSKPWEEPASLSIHSSLSISGEMSKWGVLEMTASKLSQGLRKHLQTFSWRAWCPSTIFMLEQEKEKWSIPQRRKSLLRKGPDYRSLGLGKVWPSPRFLKIKGKFRFSLDPAVYGSDSFNLQTHCVFFFCLWQMDLRGVTCIKKRVLTTLLSLAHSLVLSRTTEALSVLRDAEESQGSLQFH